MKKMKLDLDALTVESFETDVTRGRGTVVGAVQAEAVKTYPNCSQIDACPSAWNCTPNGTCYDAICAQADTCVSTCANTCAASCGSCLSNCFASGCMGCSGPVCAA